MRAKISGGGISRGKDHRRRQDEIPGFAEDDKGITWERSMESEVNMRREEDEVR